MRPANCEFVYKLARNSLLLFASIVLLWSCGGGGAGSAGSGGTGGSTTMSNPSPLVNSIAPTNITAGSAAATLTVNGSGFISTSVVEWNGSDRATIYVSATQIQATLTIADLALGGTAQVVVVNPSPGGGTSSAETFTIDNPIPQIS